MLYFISEVFNLLFQKLWLLCSQIKLVGKTKCVVVCAPPAPYLCEVIHNWLLRCSTAKGPNTGLFQEDPTMVKAYKSFLFTVKKVINNEYEKLII